MQQLSSKLLLAVILIFLFPATSEAKERVALVIGNSKYEHAAILRNPLNDAQAIADVLRKLDFDVIEGLDLSHPQLLGEVREFSRKMESAKVTLLYYAGHGVQVSGQNYIVPIDARLNDEFDLKFGTVALNSIITQMERKRRINLVFLDSCRDNPLLKNLARSMGTRSGAISRGLARVETGIGTYIGFATQPGNVSYDGANSKHSPFTHALLQHIETPGLGVEDIMRRVRTDVIRATGSKQVPWSNSSDHKIYVQKETTCS